MQEKDNLLFKTLFWGFLYPIAYIITTLFTILGRKV
jgi:hypothetical protein